MGKKRGNPDIVQVGIATRFKPGQVANPKGNPSIYRGIHRASYAQFMEELKHISSVPPDELREWEKDKERGSWEIGLAKAIVSVSEGNFEVLFGLMDRMYGKPRDITTKMEDIPTELLLMELKRRYERDKQTITV